MQSNGTQHEVYSITYEILPKMLEVVNLNLIRPLGLTFNLQETQHSTQVNKLNYSAKKQGEKNAKCETVASARQNHGKKTEEEDQLRLK